MTDPRRITGFMPLAKEIVEAQPGLTAKEIFSLAQQRSVQVGIPISASANPEASLVATLQKVYKDYDLERRGGRDGRYRFYPKGQGERTWGLSVLWLSQFLLMALNWPKGHLFMVRQLRC